MRPSPASAGCRCRAPVACANCTPTEDPVFVCGSLRAVDGAPLRVTVWGENLQEHSNPAVGAIYPAGMHTTIAEGIREHLGAGAHG